MAFDTSYRFFDDALLTIASSSTWATNPKTDHSEGSLNRQYWFGSNAISTKLVAASNPGVDPIVLTPTYILPSRQASTAYTLGTSVSATPNGYRYVCTTAGTTGLGTPTWGTILNGNTNDGTVVWTLVAEQSDISEIKLALTEAGLASATGGAPLEIGNTILSGVANAVEIWVQDTNAIDVVSSSLGQPEYGIAITASTEAPQ